MYNIDIDDEFRAVESLREKRAENTPEISNMEPHVFETNCCTVTIQRIDESSYRVIESFLSASEHDYSSTGGVAPDNSDKVCDKFGILQFFFSPIGFYYKNKWADFPEIQSLACESGD